MAVLKSFALKGNKQSFANWISNLSPADTPFSTMIGKEGIDQTQYSWQTDALSPPSSTLYEEGSLVESQPVAATKIVHNFTSILRKVVKLSETNEATKAWGRTNEMAYQMGKAGKELLRDLECMNLHNVEGVPANSQRAGKFAGFEGLTAGLDEVCPDTRAVVHKRITVADGMFTAIDTKDLFDMTYNLYVSGSKANKIMFHPKHAPAFSMLISNNHQEPLTYRLFDGLSEKYNARVSKICDPLCQTYTLIPNRFMPLDKIYFFNEKDWTQMILREPNIIKLAKNGSSDSKMVEMEVGLRHKHPFASGILTLDSAKITNVFVPTHLTFTAGVQEVMAATSAVTVNGTNKAGEVVTWYTSDPEIAVFAQNTTSTNASGIASNQLHFGNKVGPVRVWSVCRGVKSQEHTLNCVAPTIELLADDYLPSVDDTVGLTATVKKENGTLAGNGIVVKWFVSPASGVTFDTPTSVTATGVATGTATVHEITPVLVYATIGEFVSNPVVLNSNPIIEDGDCAVTPNTMKIGDAVHVDATVVDGAGDPIEGVVVTWKISDPTLATLSDITSTSDANGQVLVGLTALKKGQGTITPSIMGTEFTPVDFFIGVGAKMEFDIGPNPATVGHDMTLSVTMTGQDGSPVRDVDVRFTTYPIIEPAFDAGVTDNAGTYTLTVQPATTYSGRVTAICDDFDIRKSVDLVVSA